MTEADALRLAGQVPDDLEHDPRFPSLTSAQKVLRAYWEAMGSWRQEEWTLPFTVLLDEVPIGLQALEGKDFPARRVVDTHSWLVPSARGRGLGKDMRAAVLSFAFGHLGATTAITEAWDHNGASLGVSRALGYVDNGVDVHPAGQQMQRMVLTSWTGRVEVSGLEACLPLLGL